VRVVAEGSKADDSSGPNSYDACTNHYGVHLSLFLQVARKNEACSGAPAVDLYSRHTVVF
jgi:hypothetical protein